MKTKASIQSRDNSSRTKTSTRPTPPAESHVFKLGIDIDLNFVVTAIQCDGGTIKLPQKWTRPQLLKWVTTQINAGHTVHTVYESCGFGYTLHYALLAAGVQSLVTTPMRLSNDRRCKNDRMDARELCNRLSSYLGGRRNELKPIRVPSAQEQQKRELGRQRNFMVRELRRLENHGRALRIEFEYLTLPAGWAGPRKWKALSQECSPFVAEMLEPIVAQIRLLKEQIKHLTQSIEQSVQNEEIPAGLGALTLALLDGEICNWGRFTGRKGPGSYTGCCPSEHSSGGKQRFGSIDRHGNKHVRTLLVEAVWRLLKWQPKWHARRKLLQRLSNGAALKKKTVVALARQLAVDLWRWRTKRCSAADLGWTLKAPIQVAA